ncbi:hypothetical protein FXW30_03905 [Candidatus Liberibacter asiaticus]|nr:hypothetical protein FXW22_03970 [Candidatus Liberibacter asiaticus]KAE9510660.1 hypothetical protein FXW31_05525 [Candidatus Liberibacter asiaticus]KAE9512021.1 hypothetical protein FXW32_03895 [Candidatus Liberibacter asiaticus]KAE9513110.1 hypothetical protein FXW35_04020 [Candidatus Liberibacter asiaticus]KAE9515237.1 hypothetical protein FXW26_03865 [Candidatus Liberibacter asiaticus]
MGSYREGFLIFLERGLGFKNRGANGSYKDYRGK